MLLPRIVHEREAREVAEQIRAMMAAPFVWQGREVTVGVTIGIAIAEDGTVQSDALLRDGDAALYSAKRAGRGSAIVHRTGMSGHAERRWALKTGLRDAAGRGEFVLHYQPIVDLATGHVGRVEALIRWHHPVFGLVPPNEFIPIAEEAGHILSVGRWVIEEVCRQLRQWGSGTPAIAINLPTAQFTDPELARDIGTAMARFGIDPRMLWVEITEHMLVDDLPATVSTLNQLRKLGVSMAIDDFGTGYSSLRYLRELPVDSIKLDRSFVHGLESSPGALAIVEGITSLAHAIGLTVTAEGIETVGQLTRLRAIGCDRGQGFYLARPAPADEHPPTVTLLLPGSALSGVMAGR
ncbi:MAG: EAL domain-containing protein [Chloroflexia bacterium]|nr:EAL domain-containing protein [Chloroflexia bacterium]